jgi:hypothetical protein
VPLYGKAWRGNYGDFAKFSNEYEAGKRCSGSNLAALRDKMTVKIITRKSDARKVTIKMVDGSLVQGKVNLHHDDAIIQRVSDIFTKIPDPFIVVFEATAEGKSGRVLILNKRNVAWVSPEDDGQPPREEEGPEESSGGSWRDRLRSP